MRLRGPAPPRPFRSPRPAAPRTAASGSGGGGLRARPLPRAQKPVRVGTGAGKRVGKPAGEKGGAGGGRRVADSSLWKGRRTDTNPRGTRPPAPLLLGQEAPARTARPLSRSSPGPSASDKLFLVRGTGAAAGPLEGNRDGRGGERRAGPGSAWCPAPRLPIWRTSGRGRLSPAPSSSLRLARNRPPGLPPGSPRPSPPCPGCCRCCGAGPRAA